MIQLFILVLDAMQFKPQRPAGRNNYIEQCSTLLNTV